MEEFPQFDFVSDYSDHEFANLDSDLRPTATKAVMKEWKIMQGNLPESIYVRAYSGRLDLLRAVIIGQPKTPYHDGLFFFDSKFPEDYPNTPPKAHFRSFGLRLNPNLHPNGHICLSILNTWFGSVKTQWQPKLSSMLQVLVSIQGLVLIEWPYYNEIPPLKLFYSPSNYNEEVFAHLCKMMVHLLKSPPKNFETFVTQHFRARARSILTAREAYFHGFAIVGSYEYQANDPFTFVSERIRVGILFKQVLKEVYGPFLKAFYELDPTLIEFTKELDQTVEIALKETHPPQCFLTVVFKKIYGCLKLVCGKLD